MSKDSDMAKKYITMSKAAEMLGITHGAVFHWLRSKKLKAEQMENGHWKIKTKDIEEIIKTKKEALKMQVFLLDEKCARTKEWINSPSVDGYSFHLLHSLKGITRRSIKNFPNLLIVNFSSKDFDAWKLIKSFRERKNFKAVAVIFISKKEFTFEEAERAATLRIKSINQFPKSPKELKIIATDFFKSHF